jgi:hypothetical protein
VDYVDHESEVKCVAVDYEKKLAASGGAEGLKTHILVLSFSFFFFSAVCLAESVCVCACGTGIVCIYDLRTPNAIQKLEIHHDAVTSIQFTPDSSRILTCSADGVFKVLEVGGVEIFSKDIQVPIKYFSFLFFSFIFFFAFFVSEEFFFGFLQEHDQ